MSVLLRPPPAAPVAPAALTLAGGLAAARALRALTGLETGVKWPNDVLIHGAKVAGILTENCPVRNHGAFVMGFGVNVRQRAFPAELPGAGSLFLAAGRDYTNEAVCVAVLRELDTLYAAYRAGGFGALRADYRAHCVTLGRHVTLWRDDGRETAWAEDVDEDGALVIVDDDGRRRAVRAGEVSVREAGLPKPAEAAAVFQTRQTKGEPRRDRRSERIPAEEGGT